MQEAIRIPPFSLSEKEMAAINARNHSAIAVFFSLLLSLSADAILMYLGMDRLWASISLAVLFVVVFLTFRYQAAPVSVRESRSKVVDREHEIVLTADAFSQAVEGGMTTYVPWSFATKAEDQGEFLCLWFAPNQTFVIPRKALGAELEKEVLLFLFRKGLLKTK